MKLLSQADHIILVGTFRTSPNLFTQLVTTHGMLNDGWRLPTTASFWEDRASLLLQQVEQVAAFRVERPESYVRLRGSHWRSDRRTVNLVL